MSRHKRLLFISLVKAKKALFWFLFRSCTASIPQHQDRISLPISLLLLPGDLYVAFLNKVLLANTAMIALSFCVATPALAATVTPAVNTPYNAPQSGDPGTDQAPAGVGATGGAGTPGIITGATNITLTNNSTISGGRGGNGGNSTTINTAGGNGGTAADAIFIDDTGVTITNSASSLIIGGVGGNGGNATNGVAAGGNGTAGGNGINVTSSGAIINNSGTISGATGGNGGTGIGGGATGNAGNGGNGINITAATTTVNNNAGGIINAGAAGTGVGGAAGTAISSSASSVTIAIMERSMAVLRLPVGPTQLHSQPAHIMALLPVAQGMT